MKRILSGMQPTGRLNLGNYLGALKNWTRLQDEPDSECLYMIADLHAITVPYDPNTLAQAVREIAAAYIAAGIDPGKSAVFVQSAVTPHAELMWLLATIAQLGKLERMTQFKDKAGRDKERASLGLFAYPVLMAADILVYKATHVPVGEDQRQHLELTREVASTFNHRFNGGREFFPLPETVMTGPATRVMSLRDGTKKMSKSDESDMSRINLTDDADAIARKIRKAKTDPHPVPESEEDMKARPEAANLIAIYAGLAEQSISQVLADYGGKPFSAFKQALVDLAVETLAPITGRISALMADPAEIDRILGRGNEKADEIAGPVLREARRLMGFWNN